jgi:hypothetical protein
VWLSAPTVALPGAVETVQRQGAWQAMVVGNPGVGAASFGVLGVFFCFCFLLFFFADPFQIMSATISVPPCNVALREPLVFAPMVPRVAPPAPTVDVAPFLAGQGVAISWSLPFSAAVTGGSPVVGIVVFRDDGTPVPVAVVSGAVPFVLDTGAPENSTVTYSIQLRTVLAPSGGPRSMHAAVTTGLVAPLVSAVSPSQIPTHLPSVITLWGARFGAAGTAKVSIFLNSSTAVTRADADARLVLDGNTPAVGLITDQGLSLDDSRAVARLPSGLAPGLAQATVWSAMRGSAVASFGVTVLPVPVPVLPNSTHVPRVTAVVPTRAVRVAPGSPSNPVAITLHGVDFPAELSMLTVGVGVVWMGFFEFFERSKNSNSHTHTQKKKKKKKKKKKTGARDWGHVLRPRSVLVDCVGCRSVATGCGVCAPGHRKHSSRGDRGDLACCPRHFAEFRQQRRAVAGV